METEELLKKRFADLAEKCYQQNQYTFTGFLGLAELSCFYGIERELSYVPYTIWGGCERAERAMIRFGSGEMLGYEEEFPIVCLKICPLAEKFADALTHRDYLGALMNLGIERDVLGDIFIEGKTAWAFCTESISNFISKNLIKVKHTSVSCEISKEAPTFSDKDVQEITLQLSSERIDGVVAKVYKLSRSDSAELFRQKKIFVKGRLCENSSRILKVGDTVSVRGCGKFEYRGQTGVSRKGKLNVRIGCYGQN